MPGPNSPRGRTGRPPRTSRPEILEAARLIIQRDGWQRLTVRRLAGELGLSPMAIYHHVEDRGDLLVQLVNDHVAGLPRVELPLDPRERIVAAGRALHDALAAEPWIAEVLTTDGFLSRLGDATLWMVEAILAGARELGCTPEQSILLFRSVWYYTVGEILVRAHTRSRRADTGGPGDLFSGPDPSISDHDAAHLPALASVADQWVTVSAEDAFAVGLEAFVHGLLDQATSGS